MLKRQRQILSSSELRSTLACRRALPMRLLRRHSKRGQLPNCNLMAVATGLSSALLQ